MGLFNKDKVFKVTMNVSAVNEAEAKQKIAALQLMAEKVNTDNLTLLGKVAKKKGVNIKIKAFEKQLLAW